MKVLRLLTVGAFICLVIATRAVALPLWQLEGSGSNVHILGSIHFLRAQDYPLPGAITRVFSDADVIIFEIDLSKMDPLATQGLLQQVAIDPGGRDLEDYLGASSYRDARSLASKISIDLETLKLYEPWFAALQITQLRLAQLGFDGTYGVETQLTLQAVGEGKELGGLESLEQQFEALDTLTAAAQRDFLMQTLEDAADIESGLDSIVSAWRAGDIATLETELLQGLADQPQLYEQILVRRNRDWTRQIIGFTRSGKKYLVVVGALHLVGDDSVIRMLNDTGYSSRQIR